MKRIHVWCVRAGAVSHHLVLYIASYYPSWLVIASSLMLRYQEHLVFFPVSKEETNQFRRKWHKVGFRLTKHWTSSQTQCDNIKEERISGFSFR